MQDSGVRSFCSGTACPELCSTRFLICIPHPTLLLSMASPPISCLHPILQENIRTHTPLSWQLPGALQKGSREGPGPPRSHRELGREWAGWEAAPSLYPFLLQRHIPKASQGSLVQEARGDPSGLRVRWEGALGGLLGTPGSPGINSQRYMQSAKLP